MWECQTLGAPDTESQEQNKAESEMAWPRAPQGDDGRAVSKDSCAALLSAPTTHPQCPLPAKTHGISAGRAQVCWEFRACGEGKEAAGWRSHPAGKEGGSGGERQAGKALPPAGTSII